MPELDGQIALVTGGGRGIGANIARELRHAGARVAVAARTGETRHAISMFIVEKGTPGFTVGRALDKTGWRSSDTADWCSTTAAFQPRICLGSSTRAFVR